MGQFHLAPARSIVWNIREKESTWAALPSDYTCFADGTPFEYKIFG